MDEISLQTGLPTIYVEDELPRLIYGDAIVKEGNKYAADFIILRLSDNARMEKNLTPAAVKNADYYEKLFDAKREDIEALSFYGSDFGIERLGYIALAQTLRQDIEKSRSLTKGLKADDILRERTAATAGFVDGIFYINGVPEFQP